MNKLATRILCKQKNAIGWYVASLPTRSGGTRGKGEDWGYTRKQEQALPLSPYWQRRFAADCRRVGYEAKFRPIPS